MRLRPRRGRHRGRRNRRPQFATVMVTPRGGSVEALAASVRRVGGRRRDSGRAVAFAATYGPARRATRVDPIVALRAE